MALSFGNLAPTSAAVPYTLSKPATASSPVLTFGGAYETYNDPTLTIFKGGNTFGTAYPTAAKATSGGVLGGLSSFLSTFSMGTPVNNVEGGRGNNVGGTISEWQSAVASGQVGQIKTAQLNGQTDWVSGLKDTLGGILGYMGSSGDASGQVVTPVSYQDEGGTNWPIIIAALAAAGLAVYAYQSK